MMTAVVAVEAVAIVVLSVIVLGLLRSHALILKALHELGAGLDLDEAAESAQPSTTPTGRRPQPAPTQVELGRQIAPGVVAAERPDPEGPVADLVGVDLHGAPVHRTVTTRLEDGRPRRLVLAFLTSGCSVCQSFWDEFRRGVPALPGGAELVVIARDDAEESPSALRRLAGDLPVLRSSAAWSDYEIPGSPYFVYVDDGQVTGEGSATSWSQVLGLMTQAVDDAAARRAAAGHTFIDPVPVTDRGERDDPSRIDTELRAAGLTPADPTLYMAPDALDEWDVEPAERQASAP